MTYLDDPDHDWSIDPAASIGDLDLDQVISDLFDRLNSSTFPTPHRQTEFSLILKGALELSRRSPAPLAQCLETSMIWYYG